jgi:hypothetical protein
MRQNASAQSGDMSAPGRKVSAPGEYAVMQGG